MCPSCFDKLKKSTQLSCRTLEVQNRRINAYSMFSYENATVQSLIYALKRHGNRELFVFAAELYNKLAQDNEKEFAVVNVPRSRKNIKKYGYDHVAKPCKILCKGKDNLVYTPLLKRRQEAEDQKNLDAAQRRLNVLGKFAAVKKDIPKDILLVDDVVTTSSTMCECIKVLLTAYPNAQITCISLAYTHSDFSRK